MKRNIWTEQEISNFKQTIKTMTYEEIAKVTGRSIVALTRKASDLGIKRCLVKDITNRKHGRLTAIKFLYVNDKYNAVWLCKCDCGNEIELPNVNLTSGNTTSCGCRRFDKLFQTVKKRSFDSQKRGASKRFYTWELSFEEYVEIANKPCEYCLEISLRKNVATGNKYPLNSVDRRNNEPYYSTSNCQPVCFTCQKMKSDLTHQEFIDHIRKFQVQSGR